MDSAHFKNINGFVPHLLTVIDFYFSFVGETNRPDFIWEDPCET